MGRTRRFIAEYVTALELAPDPEPGDMSAVSNLALINAEIGIQHLYLKEADAAIDYFLRAKRYYAAAEDRSGAMRNCNNLAGAYTDLAEHDGVDRDAWFAAGRRILGRRL